MRRNSGLVLSSAAAELMVATDVNGTFVTERVLADLVAYLGADFGQLSRSDLGLGMRTVAQWPPVGPDVTFLDDLVEDDAEDHPAEPGSPAGPDRPGNDGHCAGQQLPVDIYRIGGGEGDGPPTTVVAVPVVVGSVRVGRLLFASVGRKVWTSADKTFLRAVVVLFTQAYARIAAQRSLEYLAGHDELTGLRNRRALMAHLSGRLAAGQPGAVAIACLDLDRLKALNDYLGHTSGDEFLRALGARLGKWELAANFIARTSGNEIVVVAKEPLKIEGVKSWAQKLSERVFVVEGEVLTRTVSVGVALGIPGVDTVSELLGRAEEAVRTAKADGRNQVVLFAEEMSVKGALRNEIELLVQNVDGGGGLVLRYLPEVDLTTGEIFAVEALVRWQHPTRGLLLPELFIGVGESMAGARALGEWVLRNACAEFSGWRARGVGNDAVLSVNISSALLVSGGFIDAVAGIIDEFGLDGSSVSLEIAEDAAVQDIETARITLMGLKAIGVQIAIDDFGSGASVLSHLKDLPVDKLKIDRGFVRDLGSNPDDLAIVRAIIGLASAFDLQLVAEGVETEVAGMTLLRNGCRRAQGYYLSAPVTGEEMESLLAGQRTLPHFSAT